MIGLKPELARGLHTRDNIAHRTQQRLLPVRQPMLGAELLDEGLDLVVVMPRHRGDQVVLDLVIEMTREPIVEGAGEDVQRRLELQLKPLFGGTFSRAFVEINIHRNVVHLRDPREPVRLDEAHRKVQPKHPLQPTQEGGELKVPAHEERHQPGKVIEVAGLEEVG